MPYQNHANGKDNGRGPQMPLPPELATKSKWHLRNWPLEHLDFIPYLFCRYKAKACTRFERNTFAFSLGLLQAGNDSPNIQYHV